MIKQSEINELFEMWSKLSFSKLLSIDQTQQKFRLTFVLNQENKNASSLLEDLKKITIQKHPTGSISWIGHFDNTSQYKIYRIDFLDALIKDKIDDGKLLLYLNNIKKCIILMNIFNDNDGEPK